MDAVGDDAATVEAKQSMRREMRDLRRGLVDRDERSDRVTRLLTEHPVVAAAERVMAYSTMGSEVDTARLVAWCEAHGKSVAVPEHDVDPRWPDVVIVPGLAFTVAGDRCGQGGGWYDRFLSGVRDDCVTIGVGFDAQLVDQIPTGPFDLPLDFVITG